MWHRWTSEIFTLQSCSSSLKNLQLMCVSLSLFLQNRSLTFSSVTEAGCTFCNLHLRRPRRRSDRKSVGLNAALLAVFFFSFFYRNRMFSRWKKKKEITRTSPKAYKRCLHFISRLNRRRVVLNSRPHCRAQVSDVNLAPITSTKIWLYGSDSSKRSDLNVIVWSSSQF